MWGAVLVAAGAVVLARAHPVAILQSAPTGVATAMAAAAPGPNLPAQVQATLVPTPALDLPSLSAEPIAIALQLDGTLNAGDVEASLALFDVAAAVLKASGKPKDKAKVAEAMKTLSVQTPIGLLKWGTGPVANVVAAPIIGGQWLKSSRYPVDFTICENSSDPNIPIAGKLAPYGT